MMCFNFVVLTACEMKLKLRRMLFTHRQTSAKQDKSVKACSQNMRLIYKVITAYPSVTNWSEKYQEVSKRATQPDRGRK